MIQASKDPDEEKLKQLLLIHKLATRLPWIVLSISVLAFLIILLQLLLKIG